MTTLDFGQTRVTVVGDLISDEWIHGRVDRLSPEGPWPVFVPERTVVNMGGAANVQANLQALGCPAVLLHPLRTAVKQRYIVGRHQLFRVDIEQTTRFSLQEEAELLEKAKNSCPQVLVLSDYGKGCFAGDLAVRLIKWANENGVQTVVDPKGDWMRYHSATIVTPNMAEIPGNPVDLIRMRDLKAILLTQGERGMTLFGRDGGPVDIGAQGPNVVDVVGAGDTVVAALAAGLAAGMPMVEAARMANAAAGVVVGKPGTATCSRAEFDAVYSTRPKVGLANGCFDIMHIGHVQLLEAARRQVEKLVVAINSDESIRRLKGPSRPVNDVATRASMLQSLRCVADVRVFDTEEELEQIIREEGAAVLFKGSDYEGCRITGEDIVERVVLIDTPFKSSTAAEVDKMETAA